VLAQAPAGEYPDGLAYVPTTNQVWISDESGDGETVARSRRLSGHDINTSCCWCNRGCMYREGDGGCRARSRVAVVSWCDWDTFLDEGAASMTDSLRRMRRVVAGSPVWQIMVFIVGVGGGDAGW